MLNVPGEINKTLYTHEFRFKFIFHISSSSVLLIESCSLVTNVVIRQLQRNILLGIKELCLKELTTLADSVVIRQ